MTHTAATARPRFPGSAFFHQPLDGSVVPSNQWVIEDQLARTHIDTTHVGHYSLVSDDEVSPSQAVIEERPGVTASVDVPPGGLYVAHGAVAARAVASAVSDRDPRRRAYLRHIILMAGLFVVCGLALTIAVAMLFD